MENQFMKPVFHLIHVQTNIILTTKGAIPRTVKLDNAESRVEFIVTRTFGAKLYHIKSTYKTILRTGRRLLSILENNFETDDFYEILDE